MLNKT